MSSPFSSNSFYVLLLSLLLALTTIQGLKFTVTNNAKQIRGGHLFEGIMGESRAKRSLEAATLFIWHRVFDQQKESDRKQVQEIRLVIQPTMKKPVSYLKNQEVHEIHLNAKHIEIYVPTDFDSRQLIDQIVIEDSVKFEINWMITFGVAYALQWTTDDAPLALQGGIAAVAVLEAHRKPDQWVNAGEGNRWDESIDVTAQFFYYINKRKSHFIADLNRKMKTFYSDNFFQEIAGMTIDECWKIYKEEYDRK